MDQGIGPERHQGVHIVGGGKTELLHPADLADVGPDLVGIAHPDAHQLEGRVADDFGDHHLPDEPGSPDHHSFDIAGHRIISPELTIRYWPVTALE